MANDEYRDEEWRAIPGFEGFYEASSCGRVRSLTRTITATSRWGTPQVYEREGRVLKLKRDRDGYLGCHLAVGPVNKHVKAHQVVCLAFHGPAEPGQVVAHCDGSRDNNRPENLRWATHKENHGDRRLHGTHPSGPAHPRTRTTPEMAAEVKRMRARGSTQQAIADSFGVSQATIGKILGGTHWTG